MTGWRGVTGALMALALILPLLPLAIWSVAHGWRFPDLWPRHVTADVWAVALSTRVGVLQALGTSLLIAGATAVLAVLMAVPAARALGLHDFRGKVWVQTLLLAPVILPGVAVALGLHGLFVRLGLTNTIAGVITVHLVPTLPYAILVLTGVFATYDRQQVDQARTLGARPAQVLVHVTLPALLPGITVALLFAFLVSWGQYALTLMIGGGRVITLPILLVSVAGAGRHDLTGALALLTVLPGALAVLAASRLVTGRHASMALAGPV